MLLQAGSLGAIPVFTTPASISQDDKLPAPCIFVTLESHAVTESPSTGHPVRLSQNWQITACVRAQVASPAGHTALAKLGSMADLIITSLIGWRPDASKKPLTITGGQKPSIEDGHHFLPIVFESEIVYHKAAV